VLLRSGRKSGRRPGASGQEETAATGASGPRERARWLSRTSSRAAFVTTLAVVAAITITPASGAADDIATGFAQAMRHLGSTSRNGQAFSGNPAVGALFSTSAGKLSQHFCSASVINSPHGDLVITAAHCVTHTSGTVVFVPGYNGGTTPYGVWTVTKVYVDQAWKSSQNPDDDFAILRVSQRGSRVAIEDVTGAEKLITGQPYDHQLVQVIGYPDSSNRPITCENWLKEPMTDQLEFDCGGYTDGTSGGPVLAEVDLATGQGAVIGVIGGYEQGGDTPQVSYSAVLGANAAALYKTAVAGG
jgi:V8-like Glu-specific endopeptidase